MLLIVFYVLLHTENPKSQSFDNLKWFRIIVNIINTSHHCTPHVVSYPWFGLGSSLKTCRNELWDVIKAYASCSYGGV